MPYANGRLPVSILAPIPGSGPYGPPKLLRSAAEAYNALHDEAMRRWGISMRLDEGAVGRAYRSLSRQVLAKRTYGSNAAVPGTSNHGRGINVDLMNRRQRWVMDQIGHLYGFSKRWSDAAWEWWHITFKPGVWKGHTKFKVLRHGSRGPRVKTIQKALRRRGFHSVKINSYFGDATRSAVRRFQKAHHLHADGVVGPKTWRALTR